MKLKVKIACIVLLATMAMPALALQLGNIQVRSALNQPLVAAIPLHPKNLTELDGLSVSLAPEQDFTRAGLKLTPTDQTLRFHVTTDNNGQKLILVTSSQPVTDPYLDFLVQVNTREGKQVREFVVLLNPVIAAPAPAVQGAPVAAAPPASAVPQQAAELPPASQFPQPQTSQPAPQPASPPAPAAPKPAASAQPAQPATRIDVQRGDTLSGIAYNMAKGSDVNIDQMMLALKAANPDAFFKDNINNLKAGAILRIPRRELIDQRSVAAAVAEVRRQNESWRAARPHPATVVEGTAAQAAANAAPKAGPVVPASDHLTLAPPTGEGGGANNRPGVAGGTGKATFTGLQQQLQASRDTLVSLDQANADLQSRVQSLQNISAKSEKLLSLKDSTIAELQHKLGAVQSGTAPAVAKGSAAGSASAARKPAVAPARSAATPWYMRPLTWIVAALVVLALIVLSLLGRRRSAPDAIARGPLTDPEDVSPPSSEPDAVEAVPEVDATDEDEAQAEAAEFEEPAEPDFDSEPEPDPEADAAAIDTGHADASIAAAAPEPAPPATPLPALPPSVVPLAPLPPDDDAYVDDPVDTKLDLARAYLDMDDPDSARAMLQEVLVEGTRMQKDEAKRLLAGVEG